jgi:hypothetical protein
MPMKVTATPAQVAVHGQTGRMEPGTMLLGPALDGTPFP